MKSEVIKTMQSRFDSLAQTVPGEEVEFWFARDLQEPLGYARWENFFTAISRAVESCKTTVYKPDYHFRGVTKMIPTGKGAERPVDDFMLTNHNVAQDELQGESAITREHVQNNESVRGMLGERGIRPENLPPEEDIRKLERRVKSEEKKLEKRAGRLPSGQ